MLFSWRHCIKGGHYLQAGGPVTASFGELAWMPSQAQWDGTKRVTVVSDRMWPMSSFLPLWEALGATIEDASLTQGRLSTWENLRSMCQEGVGSCSVLGNPSGFPICSHPSLWALCVHKAGTTIAWTVLTAYCPTQPTCASFTNSGLGISTMAWIVQSFSNVPFHQTWDKALLQVPHRKNLKEVEKRPVKPEHANFMTTRDLGNWAVPFLDYWRGL